jgi:hypothetical protein
VIPEAPRSCWSPVYAGGFGEPAICLGVHMRMNKTSTLYEDIASGTQPFSVHASATRKKLLNGNFKGPNQLSFQIAR